jgi:2-phosphosulfolactate phosphatase
MSTPVCCHLLPDFVPTDALRGGVAVVIDLLRASTTIVHALAHGAECVVPCETVDDALREAAACSPGAAVLGGERGGMRIEGFHLGNSPFEYTPEAVGGKTVVFTTTNGTRALFRCRAARRVLVGAFANLSALVDCLATFDHPVHLVCAGTDGHVTREDALCAGGIAETLRERYNFGFADDVARLAVDAYTAADATETTLLTALKDSVGGRNLMVLGHEADIARAAQRDLFALVPEFLPNSGRIVVSD